MVTVQNQVCKRFNKYYVSAASAIGQPDTILEACTLEKVPEKKKSLRRCTQAWNIIRYDLCTESTFELQLVSEHTVRSKLSKINVKKATGWDNIPLKVLK